jgi:hypothetical protein
MKVYRDHRTRRVEAPEDVLFRVVARLGGQNGWHSPRWIWSLRGFLDRLVGGRGLAPRRRDPRHVAPGDPVDFWRVVDVREGRYLHLRAEMKVPGEARLEFEISPDGEGSDHCRLHQTASLEARGVAGALYWYAFLPAHSFVFGRMLEGISREAERETDRAVSGKGPVNQE